MTRREVKVYYRRGVLRFKHFRRISVGPGENGWDYTVAYTDRRRGSPQPPRAVGQRRKPPLTPTRSFRRRWPRYATPRFKFGVLVSDDRILTGSGSVHVDRELPPPPDPEWVEPQRRSSEPWPTLERLAYAYLPFRWSRYITLRRIGLSKRDAFRSWLHPRRVVGPRRPDKP
jgi:hypothetical protein